MHDRTGREREGGERVRASVSVIVPRSMSTNKAGSSTQFFSVPLLASFLRSRRHHRPLPTSRAAVRGKFTSLDPRISFATLRAWQRCGSPADSTSTKSPPPSGQSQPAIVERVLPLLLRYSERQRMDGTWDGRTSKDVDVRPKTSCRVLGHLSVSGKPFCDCALRDMSSLFKGDPQGTIVAGHLRERLPAVDGLHHRVGFRVQLLGNLGVRERPSFQRMRDASG
jgi:hypothetical protein